MRFSRRLADAIARPTSSRRKSCRSSASRRIPTAPSRDARAELSSTSSPSPGSNHVHGTAFYYLRDSSFGAADPFLAFKPHNRQQQVGGTIGGPIKRNKIFFFAGFDQHIFHVPNVVEFLDGSSKVVPAGRHRALHSRGLRGHRSGAGVRRGGATDIARRRISRGANRQHVVRQARHQSHAAPATLAAPQHHALLGIEQRVSRSRPAPSPTTPTATTARNWSSTETASLSLTSGLSQRWISHFRAQFSRDRQQSYSNTSDVLVKIPTILDGMGRSNLLPRQTREHRLHLAETMSHEGGRNSWKFGGDALAHLDLRFLSQPAERRISFLSRQGQSVHFSTDGSRAATQPAARLRPRSSALLFAELRQRYLASRHQ